VLQVRVKFIMMELCCHLGALFDRRLTSLHVDCRYTYLTVRVGFTTRQWPRGARAEGAQKNRRRVKKNQKVGSLEGPTHKFSKNRLRR
jgi:hypothetical protein